MIISSMRTASRGGIWFWFRSLRTLEYEAVSTSIEKVDSGFCATLRNGLSLIRSYDSAPL